MSVWFAIPSARAAAEAEPRLAKWREKGYRLAIWRDHPDSVQCDFEMRGVYPGYYGSINRLTAEILAMDSQAQWIVTGGDDMEPDASKGAEDIAAQCLYHFSGTFGVMQPTGDRWGQGGHIYAEHVAGSPWMGREWCKRAYAGSGPVSGAYWHYYGDEELQEVAKMLGVFQQRPDLAHYHAHYLRVKGNAKPLFHRNAAALFASDGAVFKERKKSCFPGHQPL